ncbi:organomercurial lyase [Natronococcus sp. A-GB7]|uniref:organomercurial lyase n=1 Tax=Natronococcus sp. A-GB7 TaxID=3037649 RepID=UPI00241EFF14|nr:organomercurial lyase [Natronococcus sp. A-GB7]MDG5819494.1 organomercurial lyase [Natronococcus sp. A-GB7]
MTDDPCPCCGGIENSSVESGRSSNQWIAGPSVLEAELPPELRSALGRFLGVESVETLGEWASEVRNRTGGGSITVDDLCLTDEETVHRGTVGDERYQFACFYDAVILAALADRPVDIRTKSPEGTVIEARAVGTEELTVRPSEAVFSFGIDDAVASPADGEDPSLERGYAAICPYVNAFPTRAVYEEWASNVTAATVAMPLEGATDLAAELVR